MPNQAYQPVRMAGANQVEREPMCPMCFSTVAWLTAGLTSAGGLATLALVRRSATPDQADKVAKGKNTKEVHSLENHKGRVG